MELLTADYVFLVITAVIAITGLFRGFSGLIAFVAASAVAVIAGAIGWPFTIEILETIWIRWISIIIGCLVIFGIVRIIVRKLVNGLLAQPADAIFGFLLGTAVCALVMVGWALSGMWTEYSAIAVKVAELLK